MKEQLLNVVEHCKLEVERLEKLMAEYEVNSTEYIACEVRIKAVDDCRFELEEILNGNYVVY